MFMDDPALINTGLDCRSISSENPTGARGSGGIAANGRKGSPARLMLPGERLVVADIVGQGKVRHIWMTLPPADPASMRSILLEIFYDGMEEPSVSVPCMDFFGMPHGRPVGYWSALTSTPEGRGFNAYFPMPFRKRIRLELTNGTHAAVPLYHQIDYTLEDVSPEIGYLHASFRRENPTVLKQDFVVASGLRGPGRYLGAVMGLRVLKDDMTGYIEGEMKFYRDGDDKNPTICGTGLEDYVGSGWGLRQPFTALYSGVPLLSVSPAAKQGILGPLPDFVSLYRWHLPDPIVFQSSLRVTLQQMGNLAVARGEESRIDELSKRYTIAGTGWARNIPGAPFSAFAVAERQDDVCAAAFLYCHDPQPVPRVDLVAARADVAFLPYEHVQR